MSKLVNLTAAELVEEIELLQWEKGIEICKIIEKYKDQTKRSYLVRNLELELEVGVLCATESDNLLYPNNYILSGFVADGVTFTKLDSVTFKISLKGNSTITIQGLED